MTPSNPYTVPALTSTYKGVVFRSRLEARWAAYFDMIGIKWQYEPEGYKLPSGNYCPDFFCETTSDAFFVEIKPTRAMIDAIETQLSELAKATGRMVYGIAGPPSTKSQRAWSETGEPCCEAAFHLAAFKEWGCPEYTVGEVETEDDLHVRATNLRFENGVANEIFRTPS
jgi:hypothetical protein